MTSRTAKFQIDPITEVRAHEVLRRPVITEKATMANEHGQIVFQVAKDASKPEIHQAVERVFGVKVKAVNTMVTKGKTKRFRGRKGFRSDVKKAIVTLVEGQNLDVMGGA